MRGAVILALVLGVAAWLYSHRAQADPYTYHVCWTPGPVNATPVVAFQVEHGLCPDGVSSITTVPAPATCTDITIDRGSWCWRVRAAGASTVSDPSPTVTWFPAIDTDGDGVRDFADNCTLIANASQVDSDADGFGNRCDADLNGTGMVNAFDTPLFQAQLGQPSIPPVYNPADFDANGYVNAFDTAIFRQLLGSPPGPAGLLP